MLVAAESYSQQKPRALFAAACCSGAACTALPLPLCIPTRNRATVAADTNSINLLPPLLYTQVTPSSAAAVVIFAVAVAYIDALRGYRALLVALCATDPAAPAAACIHSMHARMH